MTTEVCSQCGRLINLKTEPYIAGIGKWDKEPYCVHVACWKAWAARQRST